MISAIRLQYLQNRISTFDDQWAYQELFSQFYCSLTKFALSLIKSKQSAEEVVSDVFMKIWERRRKLEEIENLRVYLYVATRNTALNYLDKQKKSITSNIDELKSEPRCTYIDGEQMMVTAELMERIHREIERLPPKCRAIFKLVKEDQLRYKEVAEILHISTKTVENQLAIALRKIGAAVRFDINRTILVSVGSQG
jgi:RNA polymerase sigma-70 factor (family 1)